MPNSKILASPVQWYRDPISCLQSTLASVLIRSGSDPLEVLGLNWEFQYIPNDARPEEFYYPCRFTGDVARSLAPGYPVRSRWGQAAGTDPLEDLLAVLAAGRTPIAAVDNYFLPFRPAYHDVHAAHLVVVYGIDADRAQVHVSDAMPPAFQGPIAAGDFLRGWGSVNPADEQDAFFSDVSIDRRYLDVRVDGPLDRLGPADLALALESNLRQFAGSRGDKRWDGLPGLDAYLAELVSGARGGREERLAELYTYSWGMQAQSALHAELLRTLGLRWPVPELREAARAVDAVAFTWTGLRITGAHGRGDPAAAAGRLHDHADRLRRSYERAFAAEGRALGALRSAESAVGAGALNATPVNGRKALS